MEDHTVQPVVHSCRFCANEVFVYDPLYVLRVVEWTDFLDDYPNHSSDVTVLLLRAFNRSLNLIIPHQGQLNMEYMSSSLFEILKSPIAPCELKSIVAMILDLGRAIDVHLHKDNITIWNSYENGMPILSENIYTKTEEIH